VGKYYHAADQGSKSKSLEIMNLRDFYHGIRENAVPFAAIVSVSIVLSIIWALISRPVYRSETSVVSASSDGIAAGLSGLSGQFGGLASLAGISLPKSGNWDQAVAKLRSRHMIEELVKSGDLLPRLFPDKWDEAAKGWQDNGGSRPSMGDAVQLIRQRVLQIREDPKTGMVTVRVDWRDPVLAAKWANQLVALADAEMRRDAIEDSSRALTALQGELERAEQVELRSAISRLMEVQVKTRMLATIRDEYAFHVIDHAVPSDLDKRVQPTRTVMVLAGGVLGVILGVFFVLLRTEWRRSQSLAA
jgi:uncharacterized protein involved in exopolysaccharide biosynthesis